MGKPDDLLTPSEVGRMLGVSADRVRQMADQGRLPVTKTTTGRRLFFRRDVDRLVASRAA